MQDTELLPADMKLKLEPMSLLHEAFVILSRKRIHVTFYLSNNTYMNKRTITILIT